MTFIILTCGGYTAEASVRGTVRDAVRLCRQLEKQAFRLTGDTHARIAMHHGETVADGGGPRGRSHGAPPYDAATATGMYDH